jgi:Bacterial Ig domain
VFLSGEIHLAFTAEMTYWKAISPARGSPVVNDDGTLTYTPSPGFTGMDTFGYTITDDAGVSASATVAVAVTKPSPPVPGLPQANDDVATTSQDTPLVIPLLANDSGTGIDVTATSDPASGAAVVLVDGSATYTPPEGFSGLDSFTYTVTDDSGASDSATVVVAVDAPPPSPIRAQANDDVATTVQDEPLVIPVLANDSGVGIEVTGVSPVELIPAARFVQLTSSPLKKEESDFRFTGNTPLAQLLFAEVGFPAERLIWEGTDPEPVSVPDDLVPFAYRFRLGQDPVLLPTVGWPPGTSIVRAPSFAWRYQLVADRRPDDASPEARPVPVQPDPLPADVDPAAPEEGYVRTAARHAEALLKLAARRVSFAANVGMVRFRLVDDSLSVRHEVFSVHPNATVPNEPDVFLLLEASLDLPGPHEEPPAIRPGA